MSAKGERTPPWLVVGALLLVQVWFGIQYVAAKILLREIPAPAWALMRVGTASLLLLLLARAAGRRLPTDLSTLGQLALLSVFGVTINQVCFVEGLSRSTPTHASLIITTIPVLTLLFAVLLRRERIEANKVAAFGAAMLGVLLILGPGVRDERARGMLIGDLLNLVNAASYSLFLVLAKRLVARLDMLAGTALLLAFGTLGVAVIGLDDLLAFDLSSVSAGTWGLAAYIVLFPTAGAYLLNYWALARVESSVVAFFIFVQPLIAAALSAWILRERPATPVWLGGTLIFAGVYVALRRRAGRPSRPSPRLGSGLQRQAGE